MNYIKYLSYILISTITFSNMAMDVGPAPMVDASILTPELQEARDLKLAQELQEKEEAPLRLARLTQKQVILPADAPARWRTPAASPALTMEAQLIAKTDQVEKAVKALNPFLSAINTNVSALNANVVTLNGTASNTDKNLTTATQTLNSLNQATNGLVQQIGTQARGTNDLTVHWLSKINDSANQYHTAMYWVTAGVVTYLALYKAVQKIQEMKKNGQWDGMKKRFDETQQITKEKINAMVMSRFSSLWSKEWVRSWSYTLGCASASSALFALSVYSNIAFQNNNKILYGLSHLEIGVGGIGLLVTELLGFYSIYVSSVALGNSFKASGSAKKSSPNSRQPETKVNLTAVHRG
jgi:hypothetical protein